MLLIISPSFSLRAFFSLAKISSYYHSSRISGRRYARGVHQMSPSLSMQSPDGSHRRPSNRLVSSRFVTGKSFAGPRDG